MLPSFIRIDRKEQQESSDLLHYNLAFLQGIQFVVGLQQLTVGLDGDLSDVQQGLWFHCNILTFSIRFFDLLKLLPCDRFFKALLLPLFGGDSLADSSVAFGDNL